MRLSNGYDIDLLFINAQYLGCLIQSAQNQHVKI